MSEQEPTWAEAMAKIRDAVGPLPLHVKEPETWAEHLKRNQPIYTLCDPQWIKAEECRRIRLAMPTTHEESRSMGYWGNEVLEKHRQCCALQSWYDPKKRMYRWFRPQDGWRRP